MQKSKPQINAEIQAAVKYIMDGMLCNAEDQQTATMDLSHLTVPYYDTTLENDDMEPAPGQEQQVSPPSSDNLRVPHPSGSSTVSTQMHVHKGTTYYTQQPASNSVLKTTPVTQPRKIHRVSVSTKLPCIPEGQSEVKKQSVAGYAKLIGHFGSPEPQSRKQEAAKRPMPRQIALSSKQRSSFKKLLSKRLFLKSVIMGGWDVEQPMLGQGLRALSFRLLHKRDALFSRLEQQEMADYICRGPNYPYSPKQPKYNDPFDIVSDKYVFLEDVLVETFCDVVPELRKKTMSRKYMEVLRYIKESVLEAYQETVMWIDPGCVEVQHTRCMRIDDASKGSGRSCDTVFVYPVRD